MMPPLLPAMDAEPCGEGVDTQASHGSPITSLLPPARKEAEPVPVVLRSTKASHESLMPPPPSARKEDESPVTPIQAISHKNHLSPPRAGKEADSEVTSAPRSYGGDLIDIADKSLGLNELVVRYIYRRCGDLTPGSQEYGDKNPHSLPLSDLTRFTEQFTPGGVDRRWFVRNKATYRLSMGTNQLLVSLTPWALSAERAKEKECELKISKNSYIENILGNWDKFTEALTWSVITMDMPIMAACLYLCVKNRDSSNKDEERRKPPHDAARLVPCLALAVSSENQLTPFTALDIMCYIKDIHEEVLTRSGNPPEYKNKNVVKILDMALKMIRVGRVHSGNDDDDNDDDDAGIGGSSSTYISCSISSVTKFLGCITHKPFSSAIRSSGPCASRIGDTILERMHAELSKSEAMRTNFRRYVKCLQFVSALPDEFLPQQSTSQWDELLLSVVQETKVIFDALECFSYVRDQEEHVKTHTRSAAEGTDQKEGGKRPWDYRRDFRSHPDFTDIVTLTKLCSVLENSHERLRFGPRDSKKVCREAGEILCGHISSIFVHWCKHTKEKTGVIALRILKAYGKDTKLLPDDSPCRQALCLSIVQATCETVKRREEKSGIHQNTTEESTDGAQECADDIVLGQVLDAVFELTTTMEDDRGAVSLKQLVQWLTQDRKLFARIIAGTSLSADTMDKIMKGCLLDDKIETRPKRRRCNHGKEDMRGRDRNRNDAWIQDGAIIVSLFQAFTVQGLGKIMDTKSFANFMIYGSTEGGHAVEDLVEHVFMKAPGNEGRALPYRVEVLLAARYENILRQSGTSESWLQKSIAERWDIIQRILTFFPPGQKLPAYPRLSKYVALASAFDLGLAEKNAGMPGLSEDSYHFLWNAANAWIKGSTTMPFVRPPSEDGVWPRDEGFRNLCTAFGKLLPSGSEDRILATEVLKILERKTNLHDVLGKLSDVNVLGILMTRCRDCVPISGDDASIEFSDNTWPDVQNAWFTVAQILQPIVDNFGCSSPETENDEHTC